MGTMEAMTAAIEANTAAVIAMTAALAAGGTAAPKTTTKPKAADKAADKPKHTAEQVRDKFIELKDATDEATAKALIEGQGVKKLAELVAAPDKWDAAMEAADEAIAEAAAGDGGL